MRTYKQPAVSELRLVTVLNAISDPIRLKIAVCLARTGEKNCSALEYDIAKSTLSHHVKLLREAGVIALRIDGKQHYYSFRMDDLNSCFPGLVQMIMETDDLLLV